jgi:hypothetical protein
MVENLELQFTFDGLRHQRQIRGTSWKGIAQCPESAFNSTTINAVASQQGKTFQELADEAFKDLLKKHHQPVGLKAALKRASEPAANPAPASPDLQACPMRFSRRGR